MKPRVVCRVATLLLAAGAGWRCGPTSSVAPIGAVPPGQQGGVSPPQVATPAQIRILGVGTHDFRSVNVAIQGVTVEVNGAAVEVQPADRRIDLASASGWVAGQFALPAAGSKVHVTLTFAPDGSWARASSSGAIDARGIPIAFDATAEKILAHGSVEVRIDLGSSLVLDGGGRLALLPNLGIRF